MRSIFQEQVPAVSRDFFQFRISAPLRNRERWVDGALSMERRCFDFRRISSRSDRFVPSGIARICIDSVPPPRDRDFFSTGSESAIVAVFFTPVQVPPPWKWQNLAAGQGLTQDGDPRIYRQSVKVLPEIEGRRTARNSITVMRGDMRSGGGRVRSFPQYAGRPRITLVPARHHRFSQTLGWFRA